MYSAIPRRGRPPCLLETHALFVLKDERRTSNVQRPTSNEKRISNGEKKDDVLSHLKAEAKACKKSVSCMIREAVVGHLEKEQKRKAKTQFLRLLRGADLGTWEDVHAERQRAEIGIA